MGAVKKRCGSKNTEANSLEDIGALCLPGLRGRENKQKTWHLCPGISMSSARENPSWKTGDRSYRKRILDLCGQRFWTRWPAVPPETSPETVSIAPLAYGLH